MINPLKVIVLLTLFSAGFCSCKQKEATAVEELPADNAITQQISLSSFSQPEKVTLSQTGINGFYSNLTLIDTFLLTADYRSPHVLDIYSTNSNKLLKKFITRGELKGQCLSVANILPLPNHKLWLYDIALGKLLKIDIHKALTDSAYWGDQEIMLTGSAKRAKSPCLVNDSVFAATTYLKDDCRFLTFDKNSTVVHQTGQLPMRKKEWPSETKANKFNILASIYTANLIKKPGEDIFFAVYNKTDRVEIYDEGKLNKVLRGPDVFEPLVNFEQDGETVMANETNDTRFSYTCISGSSRYVYCLYSGKIQFNTCSQTILIYDWNGNPVKRLETDKPVCTLTVQENKNTTIIYALEKETGNILMLKL